MIKTLVSVEVDLSSSLAIRFACQLGGLMNMEIQPVYIKESPSHESAWGAGWASRTWEKEMVKQGLEEIAELVTAEREYCPVLAEPKVIYGDRDSELLKIALSEQFDLFVEGAHFAWTVNDLFKRLHSKLHQKIPSPVILVRALRKVNYAQLLCFDMKGTEILTEVFHRIWQGSSVPLVLNYPAEASSQEDGLREAVDRAGSLLTKSGCAVSIRNTLSRDPGTDAAEPVKDCGLAAIALNRTAKKDSLEIQWLSELRTSTLLAFY